MLNQTFSLTNFEEIYDEDNRKGRNKDEDFFPEVVLASKRLSAKTRALRAFKRRNAAFKKYPKAVQRRYDVLFRNVKKQRTVREEIITAALKRVAQAANRRSFRIGLTKNTKYTKDVYERDSTPESYYALRQITRNIRSLYKTKPANRNLIVSQVQNLLSDDFPYIILRTDIASFFESVDQKRLIEKLVQDQLLSTNSMRLIKQVLWDYSKLSGTSGKGIPRGLSISSDLAELFLKVVDRQIQEIEEVVFYARYVDDILLFVSPSKASDPSIFLPKITKIVNDHGLSLNPSKTLEFQRQKYQFRFDYLGYEFTLKKSRVEIDITESKFLRIKGRISSSFKAYEKQRHKNSKAAYRLLLKRVRFLTTNTRLINSKSNAFVGVFYSNPHLTRFHRLTELDQILITETNKLSSSSLKSKLEGLSFVKGHQEIPFTKFNRRSKSDRHGEFSQIVGAWRFED